MGDMDEFRQVTALFRSGAIKPVIDSVFEAKDAPKAYGRLESAEQFGKVVVKWG
jgi:NADPH:quinone reductase-like Zn-dependent oxidoreductase